jgi:hypothetical protein
MAEIDENNVPSIVPQTSLSTPTEADDTAAPRSSEVVTKITPTTIAETNKEKLTDRLAEGIDIVGSVSIAEIRQ